MSFEDADPDEYCLYDLPANQVADVDPSERVAQNSEGASPVVDQSSGDDNQQQPPNINDIGGVPELTSSRHSSEDDFQSADEAESFRQPETGSHDEQAADFILDQVEDSTNSGAPDQINKGLSLNQESGPGNMPSEGRPAVTKKRKDWGPAIRQSNRTNPRLDYSQV